MGAVKVQLPNWHLLGPKSIQSTLLELWRIQRRISQRPSWLGVTSMRKPALCFRKPTRTRFQLLALFIFLSIRKSLWFRRSCVLVLWPLLHGQARGSHTAAGFSSALHQALSQLI